MHALRKLAFTLIVIFILLELARYFGSFLVPLAFSGVLSSVLLTLVRRLRRSGVHNTLAIYLGFAITFVFVGAVTLIFILQARSITQEYTLIRVNLIHFYDALVQFIGTQFGITEAEQLTILNQKIQEGVADILAFASHTLIATTDILLLLILVPLYSFLLIIYRHQMVRAVRTAFDTKLENKIIQVLEDIRAAMGQYLIGMCIVMLIMAASISLGLWLIGVPYPIFFGMLGGISILIPYVGISSVAVITASYGSLYYGSFSMMLPIFLVFVIAGTIEGYIITPYVVGHKVKLNPLAVILAVVFGGYIWGIAGMILSLPYLAAIAIVAEAVPGLMPLAILVRLDKGAPRKSIPESEPDA